MSSEPILVIRTSQRKIIIRARIEDDYVENEILLSPILAMYRRNNDNIIKNFLDLFESSVKRTINEFIPHKTLNMDYNVIADDDLDNATQLSVNVTNIEQIPVTDVDGEILGLVRASDLLQAFVDNES